MCVKLIRPFNMSSLWMQSLRHKRYRSAVIAALIFTCLMLMFAFPKYGKAGKNQITVSQQACSTTIAENQDLIPYAACHIKKQVVATLTSRLNLDRLLFLIRFARLGHQNPSSMVSEHKMSTILYWRVTQFLTQSKTSIQS